MMTLKGNMQADAKGALVGFVGDIVWAWATQQEIVINKGLWSKWQENGARWE
jgi:hypothetical protein